MDLAKFGEEIRKRRKALRLSQDELASAIDIYQPWLSSAENGDLSLTYDNRKKAVKLLGALSLLGQFDNLDSILYVMQLAGYDGLDAKDMESTGQAIFAEESKYFEKYCGDYAFVIRRKKPHFRPRVPPRLIGRDSDIEAIQVALASPNNWAIAVTGFGGVGKTAVAQIVEDRIKDQYDYRVWYTAKTNYLPPESLVIESIEHEPLPPEAVLVEIAIQCGWGGLLTISNTDQLVSRLRKALAESRVLVILDNLDTVPQSRRLFEHIMNLRLEDTFSCSSRFLLTSREHIARLSHDQNLKPLDIDHRLEFIREEFTRRGDDAKRKFEGFSGNDIRTLAIASYGLPLALQFLTTIVLQGVPVEALAGSLGIINEHETSIAMTKYVEDVLYEALFDSIWSSLDPLQKEMAIAADSLLDLADSVSLGLIYEEFIDDGRDPRQIMNSWEVLKQKYILIETVDSTAFTLHPVTRHFIARSEQ